MYSNMSIQDIGNALNCFSLLNTDVVHMRSRMTEERLVGLALCMQIHNEMAINIEKNMSVTKV